MYRLVGVLVFLAVALLLVVGKGPPDAQVPAEAAVLPSVESCAELTRILEEYRPQWGDCFLFASGMEMEQAVGEALRVRESPKASPDAGARYSSTNVQVQGVDEADVVKTDGQYIYQVNRQRVLVLRAYPAAEMSVIKEIEFADHRFNPQEMYLDNEHLVVVGVSYRELSRVYPEFSRPWRSDTVKAIIFDIRDKNQIHQVREVELEGRYVASRKIDKNVYLVASKYPDYCLLRESGLPAHEGLTPAYRDSLAGDSFQRLRCSDVYYFPDFAEPNYLLVAGFNLENPDQEMQVGAYLGAGENVYASRHNLYVAATERDHGPIIPLPGPRGRAPTAAPDVAVWPEIVPPVREEKTIIYRFALEDGKVSFSGRGEVPGTVLNQFSMDEHEGFFRVGTTVGAWSNDSRNALYILDADLNIAGKIEDIAPGERIYSIRFMGDRGYMVTFKTTDPLFVFDLADPRNPAVLGTLKIPGYSNYLHPYDEHHLIGFGKDAVEATEKGPDGKEISLGFAWEQGMKLALFDVTDVNNPVEKFTVHIGDRGTDSEVLHNHRALLFDREKNLLAFPITVAEIKHHSAAMPPWEYGAFTFQGAYVYRLTLDRGFEWKGGITHLTAEDYLKAGHHWPHSDRHVQRILYINENLYTLSEGLVKANDLNTLAEKGRLRLP
jgi:uncharacterized secreted protein with C-terminal beta-propeller domain